MTTKVERHVVRTPGGTKLYPLVHKGKTVYVSVPGNDEPEPGPETEDAFVRFLDEAIEAYAEPSEVLRPDVGLLKAPKKGLVVRFDSAEFLITVTKVVRRSIGG